MHVHMHVCAHVCTQVHEQVHAGTSVQRLPGSTDARLPSEWALERLAVPRASVIPGPTLFETWGVLTTKVLTADDD